MSAHAEAEYTVGSAGAPACAALPAARRSSAEVQRPLRPALVASEALDAGGGRGAVPELCRLKKILRFGPVVTLESESTCSDDAEDSPRLSESDFDLPSTPENEEGACRQETGAEAEEPAAEALGQCHAAALEGAPEVLPVQRFTHRRMRSTAKPFW